MLRPRYLAVLWLSCLIAHAQSVPGQQTDADSSAVYKLEGTVLNAHTGRGIPYALVEAYGSGKFATLTDSDGSFVLTQLRKGPLMLSARKPGFSPPGDMAARPPLKSVQIGPQLDKVVLKLVPDCAISGPSA
jgi:Carboxypeptidase regulatory-like domain